MLTVYRASAGAGKTHKLTGEYLKLLFASPGAYRHILAVTFTNKATDEMKSRIVEELFILSSGRKSDYVSSLSDQFKLDEAQVRAQAKRILIAILHDYSAFNISTIDRFFQQTMRAFTREIGLQGGYGIEMDQELVLTEAIDNLLSGLEKPESKELLGWLLRFAADKVEAGGEWNLRRDIAALSREVFKESYKAFSADVAKDIEDKTALESYKNQLFAIIRSVESEARDLGREGMAVLDQYALQTSDFKGGSRSPLNFFTKLIDGEMKEPSNTFVGLADNLEGCFTAKTDNGLRQVIGCAFDDGLNDCIKKIATLFANLTDYNTAKEIVRYYYTLGILNDIAAQIAAYRQEKNVMLIADTTELLSKVIGGSEAPFIYEKTGTQVDHYMIDEFQDTSGMQWGNFLPLLEESLSHGRDNLIVGDVKQSIYRFRNSDWKLLDEQIKYDFAPEQLHEETLTENWRSCRHIVAFNNSLFTVAPALLQDMYNEGLSASSLSKGQKERYCTKMMSAYDKSFQQVPPPFRNKEGHVRIEFISQEDQDWKEESVNKLPSVLEQLQDNGYNLKEIAILVRTNREGAMVADSLLAYKEEHPSEKYKYDIISDEALFISSSPAVRFLISMLRYLRNPGDRTNYTLALYAYTLAIPDAGETDGVRNFIPLQEFPAEVAQALRTLGNQSLYEITESLFRLFNDRFPDNEQVFVQAFMDMVSEFTQRESVDISRFLKWWDDTGSNKTIATPDAQNAIRILTIHKSKGLGFKVVIIPFGDWEIDHKPSKQPVLWCHPAKAPFNQLHLVPVRYGAVLGNTIFANDYFNEKLHAFIDNMNTLYVAFTRAKEELIVFSPRPKKPEKISSMSDLLWNGLSDAGYATTREGEPLEPLAPSFDPEEGVFELGTWWHPEAKAAGSSVVDEIPMHRISSVSPNERLQLRLHGKGFFFDNKERKHGSLMHELLSRIQTKADIASSVESYRVSGVINKQEAESLCDRLEELLQDSSVAGWYDGTARILNEVDILYGKGLSKRPDRVMVFEDRVVIVDYKFGKHEDRKYVSQIKEYITLVRQMGYPHVSGNIWYVELAKIEAVNG